MVVVSPHQNTFDMRLRIEIWPTEPPADLDEGRLQLWPAPSPIRPRRLRAWTDPKPALAMEGSGWRGDLDDLRAPDTIGWPDDQPS